MDLPQPPRNGARVGFLTKEGLLSALKELGLAAIGNVEEALAGCGWV